MSNQLYKGDTPLATFVPEIADNLTTNDSTKALSAKQGRILNIPKLVWSGNAYTIGDEIQLSSFDSNKEYLFGFKPFTSGDGIMFMPTILTNHTFIQFTFWGNSQQHAAYRLTHSGNGKFVIAQDTLGNVAGCALVEIYERN